MIVLLEHLSVVHLHMLVESLQLFMGFVSVLALIKETARATDFNYCLTRVWAQF